MVKTTSRRVELLTDHAAWAALAAAETGRFAQALGPNLICVHHIGSTAVPGLAAKPIVDLMPVVRDIAAVADARPALEALGYEWLGEHGQPGRRYCRLSDPRTGERQVHAHVFQQGSAEIDRHLAFRDYLRARPDEAQAYAAEKRRVQALHPEDSAAYSQGKGDWVVACEARALAWRDRA